MNLTLADGSCKLRTAAYARVDVSLQGRKIPTTLTYIRNTPNSKTLLGINFIEDAGLILNFRQRTWSFGENDRKHPFTQKEEHPAKRPRNLPRAEEDIIFGQFQQQLEEMTLIQPMVSPIPRTPSRRERPLPMNRHEWDSFDFMFQDAIMHIDAEWDLQITTLDLD